jgi:hypothetical protein
VPSETRSRILLLLVALAALGCASARVPPEQLPAAPRATLATGETLVLALEGAPAAMADELRAFAAGAPLREAPLRLAEDLVLACGAPGEIALRARPGRAHFASNAPDRNTLFIYETAIVVGIPVTLVSAAAWPWYGETVVDGELERVRCASSERETFKQAFHVRTRGRGFVRTATIRDAQKEAALRGVTRKLLVRSLAAAGP